MNMNERVRHIKDIISAKEKHPDIKAARCRKSDGGFPATELIFERHPVRKAQGSGVAEWCLSETHQQSRVGCGGDCPIHLWYPRGLPSSQFNQWLTDWGEKTSWGSSRSNRSRQLGPTRMKRDEVESSTPQSSVMASVMLVEKKKNAKTSAGGPRESSKARYLERVNDLDLEDLACRRELMKVLGLKDLPHEDLSNHFFVDWMKADKAHFSGDKTLEKADITEIPKKSSIVPVNYRPLKEMGSPGFVVKPPKHRTSIVRIRVAIPAQLKAVEKIFEPKSMWLPDTA